ncbi:Serine proteases trypsin domain [Trinorchestia longiramus]|nr:Serine proteases trypsin domain [Trinorchestia longiramus]
MYINKINPAADAGTVSFAQNPAPQGLNGTAEEITEQLKLKKENLCSLDPKELEENELSASILEVFSLHYLEVQPMNHFQKYRILCRKPLEFSYSKLQETNASGTVASASLTKFYNVVKKYTSDVNEFRLQLCKIWKSIPSVQPSKAPSYDPCHEHEEELSIVQGPETRPEEILDELLGDILEASNDREAATYVMGEIIEISRSPIQSIETEKENVTGTVPVMKPKSIREKVQELLVLDDVPKRTTYRELQRDLEGIEDESRNSEVIQLISNIEGLEFEPKIRYKKGLIPCRKTFSYKGCGRRQQSNRVKRIVNGVEALPGHWPWTVVVNLNPYGLGSIICGGTLISDRYVITAGHCIVRAMIDGKRTLDYFSVKVGVLQWEAPVEAIQLKAFHAAPLYDADSFADDIAVLELFKPVTFNETVQPICLPQEFEDFIGQQAYVTGWGHNQSTGSSYTDFLQETEVQVLSQHKCCQVLKSPQDSLEKRKAALCAGYVDGRTDACQGDSGGPLMVETQCGRWVLIGVVSYGQSCAEADMPGIYSSVPHFRRWITQITKLEDVVVEEEEKEDAGNVKDSQDDA